MALAFFDLDGTLTKCDTFIPFCFIALLRQPWRLINIKLILKGSFKFLIKKINQDELKEIFIISFLAGLTIDEINVLNKIFFRIILPLIIRKKIFKKVQQHKKQFDRVYIVSASPNIYVEQICKKWDLEGAICTILELDKKHLTGRILGKNCRGVEKKRRIKCIFNESDLEGSFAYGNSYNDKEMLELVSFGMLI